MALVPWRQCGKDVAQSAGKCPHCGVQSPGISKKALWIIYASLAAAVTTCVFSSSSGCKDGDTECQRKKEAQALAEKYRMLPYGCAAAWESQNKRTLRDPDSLKFDYDSASIGTTKKGDPIVALTYRAKNGFGGTTPGEAACLYDTETLTVKSVLK